MGLFSGSVLSSGKHGSPNMPFMRILPFKIMYYLGPLYTLSWWNWELSPCGSFSTRATNSLLDTTAAVDPETLDWEPRLLKYAYKVGYSWYNLSRWAWYLVLHICTVPGHTTLWGPPLFLSFYQHIITAAVHEPLIFLTVCFCLFIFSHLQSVKKLIIFLESYSHCEAISALWGLSRSPLQIIYMQHWRTLFRVD